MVTEEKVGSICNGLIDEFIQESAFFRAWDKSSVDASIAQRFLITFDSLVKSFPSLIAAGAARMEDEETRTTLAVNLFQECGEGDVKRTHHAIYRKYLATAGISVEALEEPAFAVEWRSQLVRYIQNGSTSAPAALGALAAGEFLAQPALSRIYGAIEPLYPGADKEYFTKHLVLETEHVQEITSTIVRQMKNDRDFQEVLTGFKFGLSVWMTFFQELADFILEKQTV
jgi:pyrroloquinoline quinone (PQQ) biosynthesis protein C